LVSHYLINQKEEKIEIIIVWFVILILMKVSPQKGNIGEITSGKKLISVPVVKEKT